MSRFVLGGADLMFPGINIPPKGLPSFLSGQPWAVKVPGNLAPIAVSSLHIDACCLLLNKCVWFKTLLF